MIIDQLMLSPALENCAATVIYRPADVQTSALGRSLERQVSELAAALVACSSHVASVLDSQYRNKPRMVLENGVDPAFFQEHSVTRDPSFVYVGALDRRFDWGVVTALSESFPGVPFRLAGPMKSAVPALPSNVSLLGPVPYESVPRLLQGSSIGLLPLTDDPMNAGRSPMKYYEYLASGLRVLSRTTVELEAREAIEGVALYDSQDEAVARAAELLQEPSPNTAGIAAARDFSWPLRAGLLHRLLAQLQT